MVSVLLSFESLPGKTEITTSLANNDPFVSFFPQPYTLYFISLSNWIGCHFRKKFKWQCSKQHPCLAINLIENVSTVRTRLAAVTTTESTLWLVSQCLHHLIWVDGMGHVALVLLCRLETCRFSDHSPNPLQTRMSHELLGGSGDSCPFPVWGTPIRLHRHSPPWPLFSSERNEFTR